MTSTVHKSAGPGSSTGEPDSRTQELSTCLSIDRFEPLDVAGLFALCQIFGGIPQAFKGKMIQITLHESFNPRLVVFGDISQDPADRRFGKSFRALDDNLA